jgi:opacity protein-like surface antigen
MKRLLLASLLLASLGSQAQIRKVPSEVTDSFKTRYPQAEKVEWRDKLTGFAAGFESSGKKAEARFNNKGVWQQTSTEIGQQSLPAPVKDGFDKSKWADWEITATFLLTYPQKEEQYLLAVRKNDLQKRNLVFSQSGRLLRDNISF